MWHMFREEFVGLKKCFALHEFLGYLVEQAKVGLFSSKEVDKNQHGGIVYDKYHNTKCKQFKNNGRKLSVVIEVFQQFIEFWN